MNEVLQAISTLGYNTIDLSLAEAKNILNQLTENGSKTLTPEILRDLANRVLADALGDLTVLYGGKIQGEGAGQIVNKMAESDPNLRVIKNTPAAQFLLDPKFNKAVADAVIPPRNS